MSLADLAVGAGLASVGMLWQAVLQRIRRPRIKPVEARCGCRHARAFHVNGTGKCEHASTNSDFTGYDSNDNPTYKEVTRRCTCQQYDGPIPVEQYFATPMLPPSD